VASKLDPFEPVLRRLLEEWPQIKAPRATELLREEYGYRGSPDSTCGPDPPAGDSAPQRGPTPRGRARRCVRHSAPTMTRHLRVLLTAGIVGDERPSDDARTRVFWLRPESITPLRDWLDELQTAGDEQLASFKRHLEGRSGA
jgi:hypothetical protein